MEKPLKPNPIVDLTFQFSLKIVDFCTKLSPIEYMDLRRQIFKAGTSIGANVWEAQQAESRSDFVHKLKISAKESSESRYWLMLCKESPHLPNPDDLLADINPIQKLLGKIISTTKRNLKN